MALLQKESITIQEAGTEGNKVRMKITLNFNGYYDVEVPEGKLYTFYIPAMDLCYSAPTIVECKKIGKSATGAFLHYWGEERSKFMMRIKVLGFVPSNDVWQSVMKKQRYQNAAFTYRETSSSLKKIQPLLNRYYDKVEVEVA